MKWANELSIIVPVGPGDESWRVLLLDLVPLKETAEILFIAVDSISLPPDWQGKDNIRVFRGLSGRAKQMNLGAEKATREILWFLHSDSKFTSHTLKALGIEIERKFQGVRFFNLGFFEGPNLMWINTFGVWIRSHCLKLPFGDQGFLMPRSVFEQLGRFNEDAAFGEDHLLIWKAHEMKIPIKPIPEKLLTSARKYLNEGWWSATRKHLILTIQQAKAEWYRIRGIK